MNYMFRDENDRMEAVIVGGCSFALGYLFGRGAGTQEGNFEYTLPAAIPVKLVEGSVTIETRTIPLPVLDEGEFAKKVVVRNDDGEYDKAVVKRDNLLASIPALQNALDSVSGITLSSGYTKPDLEQTSVEDTMTENAAYIFTPTDTPFTSVGSLEWWLNVQTTTNDVGDPRDPVAFFGRIGLDWDAYPYKENGAKLSLLVRALLITHVDYSLRVGVSDTTWRRSGLRWLLASDQIYVPILSYGHGRTTVLDG